MGAFRADFSGAPVPPMALVVVVDDAGADVGFCAASAGVVFDGAWEAACCAATCCCAAMGAEPDVAGACAPCVVGCCAWFGPGLAVVGFSDDAGDVGFASSGAGARSTAGRDSGTRAVEGAVFEASAPFAAVDGSTVARASFDGDAAVVVPAGPCFDAFCEVESGFVDDGAGAEVFEVFASAVRLVVEEDDAVCDDGCGVAGFDDDGPWLVGLDGGAALEPCALDDDEALLVVAGRGSDFVVDGAVFDSADDRVEAGSVVVDVAGSGLRLRLPAPSVALSRAGLRLALVSSVETCIVPVTVRFGPRSSPSPVFGDVVAVVSAGLASLAFDALVAAAAASFFLASAFVSASRRPAPLETRGSVPEDGRWMLDIGTTMARVGGRLTETSGDTAAGAAIMRAT